MGLVIGIVVAALFVIVLVGLYVWTRRSERDVEIPTRELTDEEKRIGIVQRGAAGNILGGMGGGGGGV